VKPGGISAKGMAPAPLEVGVKRTAACARRGMSLHRLLRVLAAVLLLVRAIQ
jgi:hypothetical protein